MQGATLDMTAVQVDGDLLLPAHSSWLQTARRHVELVAQRAGLDAQRSARFVYAVNEAVTNAIRHGKPDGEGRISLRTVLEDSSLIVHVRDSGSFSMPSTPPGQDAESGRGFALMSSFADEVRLDLRPGATTVTLVACLP